MSKLQELEQALSNEKQRLEQLSKQLENKSFMLKEYKTNEMLGRPNISNLVELKAEFNATNRDVQSVKEQVTSLEDAVMVYRSSIVPEEQATELKKQISEINKSIQGSFKQYEQSIKKRDLDALIDNARQIADTFAQFNTYRSILSRLREQITETPIHISVPEMNSLGVGHSFGRWEVNIKSDIFDLNISSIDEMLRPLIMDAVERAAHLDSNTTAQDIKNLICSFNGKII